jgi:hypothetical protein
MNPQTKGDMKRILKCLSAAIIGAGLADFNLSAQTDGAAVFRATLVDYRGSTSASHWTAVWITTEGGTFVKTVWRQGKGEGGADWGAHLGAWISASGGSTNVDGYSSATATTYNGTNSPVIWSWNCRDANNNLVADGTYKFWINYAENSGQGPYSTNGMLWTKGSIMTSNSYANFGTNILNASVVWSPVVPPPPVITSILPSGNKVVMSGTGPANKTNYLLLGTNLTQPVAQWKAIATNKFDNAGNWGFTNTMSSTPPPEFYRLQVP